MSTTTIFAEILVIGAQALLSFFFIALGVMGEESVLSAIRKLPQNELILGGFLLVLAYSLGVITDRAYVFAWKWIDKRIRNDIDLSLDSYVEAQVIISREGSDELNTLISFHTSRLRILRASMCNLFLISLSLIVSLIRNFACPYYPFGLVVALILLIGSIYGYINLSERYYSILNLATSNLSD